MQAASVNQVITGSNNGQAITWTYAEVSSSGL